jgi:hypothetical protein
MDKWPVAVPVFPGRKEITLWVKIGNPKPSQPKGCGYLSTYKSLNLGEKWEMNLRQGKGNYLIF